MDKEFDKLREKKIELRQNRHTNDGMAYDYCLEHVKEEYKELMTAVEKKDIEGIAEELADLANCCEFTYKALKKEVNKMEDIVKEESLTPYTIRFLIKKYEEAGVDLEPEYGTYKNSLTMRIANYFGSEGDRNSRILANLIAQRLVQRIKKGKII